MWLDLRLGLRATCPARYTHSHLAERLHGKTAPTAEPWTIPPSCVATATSLAVPLETALQYGARAVRSVLPDRDQVATAGLSLACGLTHVLTAPSAYVHRHTGRATAPPTLAPSYSERARSPTQAAQTLSSVGSASASRMSPIHNPLHTDALHSSRERPSWRSAFNSPANSTRLSSTSGRSSDHSSIFVDVPTDRTTISKTVSIVQGDMSAVSSRRTDSSQRSQGGKTSISSAKPMPVGGGLDSQFTPSMGGDSDTNHDIRSQCSLALSRMDTSW